MQTAASISSSVPGLKPCEEPVLQALQRYYCLTSRQLCRLLYSRGSLTYIQSRLKSLVGAGYVERVWMPKRGPSGSSPAVYVLARRGLNHLKRLGAQIDRRHRPAERGRLSYLFLAHTIELNDFLIAAEELERSLRPYKVAAVLHEHTLKRHPVHVINTSGKAAAVIPDAWLDLRVAGTFQVCLVVELDRGTEQQRRWRQKISNLLAFADGPYQEAFGTSSLTITVPTTAGERRLAELLRWTEAELAACQEESLGDLFIFASLFPGAEGPREVFLTPRWYQPFRREPVALLDGAG
jgi:hypothetical protein